MSKRLHTAPQAVLPKCYFSAKFGYFFIWLAGKIFVWRLADFLAISEIFWRKIWLIFVQNLDQCLLHKKDVKIVT